jgi:hypothetical protein
MIDVVPRRVGDPTERAADVQPPFALQDFHTSPADGSVYVLVDPRQWDRRQAGQDGIPRQG